MNGTAGYYEDVSSRQLARLYKVGMRSGCAGASLVLLAAGGSLATLSGAFGAWCFCELIIAFTINRGVYALEVGSEEIVLFGIKGAPIARGGYSLCELRVSSDGRQSVRIGERTFAIPPALSPIIGTELRHRFAKVRETGASIWHRDLPIPNALVRLFAFVAVLLALWR